MFGMSSESTDIDRIDRRILDVLQRDGRISNLKLAEAVALSPTAVLARVQRLTRAGYILGYEARLNPLLLGAGMLVFVEVLLDRTSANVFEQFKAAVQVRAEIMECHLVAGGFDYLLKIRCADMNAYRQFSGDVLWQLPGVRETPRAHAFCAHAIRTPGLMEVPDTLAFKIDHFRRYGRHIPRDMDLFAPPSWHARPGFVPPDTSRTGVI